MCFSYYFVLSRPCPVQYACLCLAQYVCSLIGVCTTPMCVLPGSGVNVLALALALAPFSVCVYNLFNGECSVCLWSIQCVYSYSARVRMLIWRPRSGFGVLVFTVPCTHRGTIASLGTPWSYVRTSSSGLCHLASYITYWILNIRILVKKFPLPTTCLARS